MNKLAALMISTTALTALAGGQALAQSSYPEEGRTVTIMVGFGAGGGTDIAGRMMADALEERLGGTFIVENYPGGGGLQALTRLVPAEPDGYTLAFVPLPATNMLYLDPDRGGDFTLEDITPIAMHDYGSIAFAVAADSDYTSLNDIVADVEAGETVTAGSGGALAAGHLGVLSFEQAAGVDLNWTAIGEPGVLMSTLLGGDIEMISDTYSELYPSAENGDIRFIASLDEPPSEVEGVETAVDQGFDVTLTTNRVLIGPAGLPEDVVSTLESAIEEITSDSEYQAMAEERAVQLRYRDAEGARELWQGFDETFQPLVDDFRKTSQQ